MPRSSEISLADRVANLEAESEIFDVLRAYGAALDYGPLNAFLDVFTEDATWRRAPGRYGPRVFEQRSEFVTWYHNHTHAPDFAHKHAVVNPTVEVNGDEATATFYLVYVNEDPEGPYIRAFSRCHDLIVRDEDGQWRIKSRVAELESMSPKPHPWVPASST